MEVCKSWIQIVMYYDNDDLILISITMVFLNLLLEWPQMCEVRKNL